MIRVIALSLICLTMVGCSSHMKVTIPDHITSKFKTSEKVDKVLVSEKIRFTDYKKLLVVKSESGNDKYVEFLTGSFRNLNVFEKVMSQKELELFVIRGGFTNKVNNVRDFIGLRQFYENYGAFLILDCDDITKPPGFLWKGNIKVYDPQDGRLLFHSYHKTFAWNGMDEPMFYPLFNSFVDWIHQQN